MSPTKPRRMDGYIRVSRVGTRNAESESYITEAVQREKIEQWAALRGVELGEWFVDRDQTGSKLSRPGFDACMERIREGKTDGIVVAQIDRLSRADVADALMIVRQVHDDFGGLVASVDLGIDPTTEVGEMLLTVLLALARMQWRRYQAAWEVAKARAIARGAHVGPTPLGYRRGEDSRLVPDEQTAPVVQEAFRLAATKGLRAAAAYLRSSRVTREFRHPRRGAGEHERYWDMRAVRRILGSRVYLGEIRYGDGAVNTEAHEPLVDLATWTQANHDTEEPTVRANVPRPYALSGIARCASCGDALSGSRLGRGQFAYRCRRNHHQHTRRGDQAPCTAPAIVMAEGLEEYVHAALVQHVATEHPQEEVVLVPGVDARDVEHAEAALRSAELARTRDTTDVRLRDVLGEEAFFERMEAHNDAVAAAQATYEEAVAASQPEVRWPLADEVATATTAQLPELLERCGLSVVVRRGQGDLPERVSLESKKAPE